MGKIVNCVACALIVACIATYPAILFFFTGNDKFADFSLVMVVLLSGPIFVLFKCTWIGGSDLFCFYFLFAGTFIIFLPYIYIMMTIIEHFKRKWLILPCLLGIVSLHAIIVFLPVVTGISVAIFDY